VPGRKPKPIDPGAPPAAAQLGRKLRIERGLTQTALGKRAGFTAQHISGSCALAGAPGSDENAGGRLVDVGSD
jgi:hypothetical protein